MRHTKKVKGCSKNQSLIDRNSIDEDRNNKEDIRMHSRKLEEGDYDILNIKHNNVIDITPLTMNEPTTQYPFLHGVTKSFFNK